MENDSKVFGNLFNKIDLISEDHLEVILETMDRSHSILYLIEAVKSAHDRGAFSIGETEVLSKAIRVLSRSDFSDE